MGFFGTLGHYLLIHGYKRAPVSMLTPFLYLQIGFAMLYGWLIFAHVPDAFSLTGVAIVALSGAAGTYVAARESRRA
jgi:drug/metabolite transporter (DMT)-like permease